MKYTRTNDEQLCAKALADRIVLELNAQHKVLWLIPGGSNIAIATEAMNRIRAEANAEYLHRLAVTLTDERYGNEGHKDSNWKQLLDAGCRLDEMQATPILRGLSLEETVDLWSKEVVELFDWADVVIGQFGMGADGHVAGVLPHTVGVLSRNPAVAYGTAEFVRITLTLSMIEAIDVAYLFVFGESKREAIRNLQQPDLSLGEQPAQVLKSIKECYVYSDHA